MATQTSPSVRLRLRRGAGFMHQALGLDFRATDTLIVPRGLAEAAVEAWPEDFLVEEQITPPAVPAAEKE